MFHRRSKDEKEKKVTYDLDSLYGSGFLDYPASDSCNDFNFI